MIIIKIIIKVFKKGIKTVNLKTSKIEGNTSMLDG